MRYKYIGVDKYVAWRMEIRLSRHYASGFTKGLTEGCIYTIIDQYVEENGCWVSATKQRLCFVPIKEGMRHAI